MAKEKKHINRLEQNRGLILQISLIIALLIMLAIFNIESKSTQDKGNSYVEINLELDSLCLKDGEIKRPTPDVFNVKITEHATFKGGKEALKKYFKENLNYPKEALNQDIQGRVYVKFKITEYGKIKDVKVIRSIHPLIDNEAIRLINTMPDWIPAKANDEQVRSEQVLPVIFINNLNKKK